jgi:hypothetical protein
MPWEDGLKMFYRNVRKALRRRPFLFIAVAISLSIVGCSEDAAETGEWVGAIYDSAGVTIVENPEGGLWTSSTAWRLEEELRIGVAHGDPVREFGVIAGIGVGPDDRIYVLDRQSREIRVFDRRGDVAVTFGRPGGGPGELTGPSAVLIGESDTVFVPDSRNQRVQRFLSDGSEAGSFAISSTDGIPMGWRLRSDGMLVQEVRTLPLPTAAEERILLLIRDGDGGIRDTLVERPVGEAMVIRGGQPQMTMFAPEPMWTTLTDGRVATGRNSEYRIEIRTGDGRLERVVRRTFERRHFSPADRRAVRELIRESMQDQGPSPATDQLLQSMEYAEHYPVFASLFGGPQGTLWVRQAKDASSLAPTDVSPLDVRAFGASDYHVFDVEGRFLGRIEVPDQFEPLHTKGEHIYGVQRDAFGVQYVVRLRVQR